MELLALRRRPEQLIAQSAGRVQLVKEDATSKESITAAAIKVDQLSATRPWIISLAGTRDDLESSFITNTTSTHLVTSPLLPVLNRGDRKKVVRITTTVGSITVGTKDKVFPVPAHKVSKAAQNMLTVQYAQSFADEECTFVAVSVSENGPGRLIGGSGG
ncbi:uncharacterized protein ATNIH1004_010996 [Aspergillus tanneri]|uniref:Uncharacterized protein n=1 Tax=Aspergillus tanneri TaxID=1220188 RepID=A0A5M9M8W4_9EURO|nr:uncharacterized protein ATNIH1004_010996 [Aspergillus tanneri]KAA8642056.1 hypothetical protein ATNIH1004_010996 [Aspergillus tanneri]